MSDSITALCTRTLLVGGGNHFEVLIPLSDINPDGQTYQVIRSSERNRAYVPFVVGIEPYVTEIMAMEQGFDRYHVFNKHEAEANLKQIAILRQAFPESVIDETCLVLWNAESLPSKEVRLNITPDGLLLPTGGRRARPEAEARP